MKASSSWEEPQWKQSQNQYCKGNTTTSPDICQEKGSRHLCAAGLLLGGSCQRQFCASSTPVDCYSAGQFCWGIFFLCCYSDDFIFKRKWHFLLLQCKKTPHCSLYQTTSRGSKIPDHQQRLHQSGQFIPRVNLAKTWFIKSFKNNKITIYVTSRALLHPEICKN